VWKFVLGGGSVCWYVFLLKVAKILLVGTDTSCKISINILTSAELLNCKLNIHVQPKLSLWQRDTKLYQCRISGKSNTH
jgi:hypothetical protein